MTAVYREEFSEMGSIGGITVHKYFSSFHNSILLKYCRLREIEEEFFEMGP